jgi:signal transduction histidine kinase
MYTLGNSITGALHEIDFRMKHYLKTLFTLCLVFGMIPVFCQQATTIADSSAVLKELAQIKKSNAYQASIVSLKKLLALPSLTNDETLALQSSLIHQYQELQKWDTCLHYCQQLVATAHQQNNGFAEATFYKHLGNTYYFIPDKDKAVEYWEKSIAISLPAHYNILLEQCYHNIGSVYLERGEQLGKAEDYFLMALKLGLVNYAPTSFENTQHYRLLASLYANSNQLKKAEDLYLDVIEKSKALKDTAHLSETLTFYSDLLIKKKEYDKAVQTSAEALTLSRNIKSLDLTYTALDFHSRNLFAAGRYKEAYTYREEMEQASRERFKTDLNDKIGNAEAKFKTAELAHDKEIAAIKAKKEKQLYILSFISFIIITGFSSYYLYQKKNAKQKTVMQQQVQQEKERLSRDLHDNLGSQMALLSNNIETLDINFKKQHGIGENIEKVKDSSKQLLQILREAIWILNKDQVTAQDFFDKLIDHTQRFLQSYPGIKLKVEGNFPEHKLLNSNEALQLFRICQEAVTNACKYSGSQTLVLKAAAANKNFSVTIQDFGKGFETGAVESSGHYGLKNMRQRARSVGAAINITAENNKGVSMIVTI